MHLLVQSLYNLHNYLWQWGCGQAPAVKVAENKQVSSVCKHLAVVYGSLFTYALRFLLSTWPDTRQRWSWPYLAWPGWAESEPSSGKLRLMLFSFILFCVCPYECWKAKHYLIKWGTAPLSTISASFVLIPGHRRLGLVEMVCMCVCIVKI